MFGEKKCCANHFVDIIAWKLNLNPVELFTFAISWTRNEQFRHFIPLIETSIRTGVRKTTDVCNDQPASTDKHICLLKI